MMRHWLFLALLVPQVALAKQDRCASSMPHAALAA